MIDRFDAKLIAGAWLSQDDDVMVHGFGFHEFDLGYLFWRKSPPGRPQDVGAGRIVVDRHNGEMTHWPSVPVDAVIEQYRAFRAEHPPAPLTWDPVVRAKRDRVRAPFPENVTHLRLADGRLRIGRSMKGEGTPNLHPLVREFLDGLPPALRERGHDRCAEVAALSDALHAEDARRAHAGEPPLSLSDVRERLLRGADLVTYRIREPGDPTGGQPTAPCVSCQALLRHFGFGLQAPAEGVG